MSNCCRFEQYVYISVIEAFPVCSEHLVDSLQAAGYKMHDCSCIVVRTGTVSDFVSLDRSRCAKRGLPSAVNSPKKRHLHDFEVWQPDTLWSCDATSVVPTIAVSLPVSQHSLSCYHRLSDLLCIPSLFFVVVSRHVIRPLAAVTSADMCNPTIFPISLTLLLHGA